MRMRILHTQARMWESRHAMTTLRNNKQKNIKP